jgi:Tol biopolymer transport system component
MSFANGGSYYFVLRTGGQDVYSATIDWATGAPTAAPALISHRFTGANRSGDWSPDGKSLAYVTVRGLMSESRGWQLLSIQTVETGKIRELALNLNFFQRPRWAPDGRSVLVVGQDPKGVQGIYRVDVNTREVTAIIQSSDDIQHIQHEWSADGKAVIFQRNNFANRSARLMIREVETGQERELYRVSNSTSSSFLAPSPDGRQLAFVVYDYATKTSTIKLVPISGGEARDLFVHVHDPKDSFFFSGIAWKPDGRELLLVKSSNKSSESKTEIWRLSAEGGKPQAFGLTGEWLRDLRIHPDGKRVSFTAGAQKYELWAMENFLPAPTVRKASARRR